jgi:maleate isomerase
MANVLAPEPGAIADTGWRRLTCSHDGRPAERAMIGLITLATDPVIEDEMRRYLAVPGVGLYANRIPMATRVDLSTLGAMADEIAATAALILPNDDLDVVAYGCTSGAMTIGPERVAELVRQAKPGAAVTNPISAGLTGLKALGARRIAVITPYIDEINAPLAAFIEAEGFDIVACASFKQETDPEICRVTPVSIGKAALEVGAAPDAEALFISCTGMRASGIIGELERELGKPVVASNQALSWHALRLAGLDDRVEGYGKLMTLPL